MSAIQTIEIKLGEDQIIRYGVCGEADLGCVVLCTHWPQPTLLFGELAQLLADTGWRVIIPELRAHPLAGPELYNEWLELHSKDIERICDAETEEPVAFVGHAGGGHVGLTMLGRCPEMISNFVGMNLPLTGDLSFQPQGKGAVRSNLLRQLDLDGLALRYWSAEKSTRQTLKQIPRFEHAHLWANHRFNEIDFVDIVATSPVPVLLIDGCEDRLNVAARCASLNGVAALSWVEIASIEGAGHFMMLDATDELGVMIDAFIAPIVVAA